MLDQILNSHKSVIVLNGSIEGETLLPYIAKSDCIIAADGAAMQLDQWGIEPHYIVGEGALPIFFTNSIDFSKSVEF